VLELRQGAGRPDADHGAAGEEFAKERLNVRGSARLGKSDVDGGQNAAARGKRCVER